MEKNYTHLTNQERLQIYRQLADGRSGRQIAQTLGRNASSIYREIKRNRCPLAGLYLPDTARYIARSRRNSRGSKIECSKQLQKTIENFLAMEWSPQAIAGRLKQELDKQIISHEAIYKWIYGPGKHRQLQAYLAKKKRKRGRRPCRKVDKIRIPGRTSIHKRPNAYKEQFGHWEGDTIHLSGHKGAILTLYEKKSKLTLGAKMHTRKSNETIDYMKLIFDSIPAEARRSVTFDNGLEFSDHEQLKGALQMETYFCDPYSSWQKGGVENANGILRRKIPKGTRTEDCTAEEVQRYLHRMNLTPRKSLGYLTPYESYLQNLINETKLLTLISPSVALQN